MATVLEIVGEKIAKSGENVLNKVVDILVTKEVDKRVETVIKALSKLESLEKEVKQSSKPDIISYTTEGQKVESTSAKAYENHNKLRGQLENLRKAFDAALDKNDNDSYNKLNGLLGGNKQEGSTEVKPQA